MKLSPKLSATKLNHRGVGHHVVMALVIVAVGVIGSYFLVFSHAFSGVGTTADMHEWDSYAPAIRQCESTNNYTNNDTGHNGHYGAYQFAVTTWHNAAVSDGYGQYANRTANYAPPQVQDYIAYKVFLSYKYDSGGSGFGAWTASQPCWGKKVPLDYTKYAPSTGVRPDGSAVESKKPAYFGHVLVATCKLIEVDGYDKNNSGNQVQVAITITGPRTPITFKPVQVAGGSRSIAKWDVSKYTTLATGNWTVTEYLYDKGNTQKDLVKFQGTPKRALNNVPCKRATTPPTSGTTTPPKTGPTSVVPLVRVYPKNPKCTTTAINVSAWDPDHFSYTGPTFVDVEMTGPLGSVLRNANDKETWSSTPGHTHGFTVKNTVPGTYHFTVIGVNTNGARDGKNTTVSYAIPKCK